MLQPSSEPSLILNVDPIPDGRLIASEWACESPTITNERGSTGGVTGGAGIVVVVVVARVVSRAARWRAALGRRRGRRGERRPGRSRGLVAAIVVGSVPVGRRPTGSAKAVWPPLTPRSRPGRSRPGRTPRLRHPQRRRTVRPIRRTTAGRHPAPQRHRSAPTGPADGGATSDRARRDESGSRRSGSSPPPRSADTAEAATNRTIDPSVAPATTKIGQCHRYHP